jgi:hypothetical protein
MGMTSNDTDKLYDDIHRLQKLIHGADVPCWLNKWTIFKYPPGVVDGWRSKLDQLLEQDLQQRPHILRNGGRSP